MGTAKPAIEAFELIADRLGANVEDCFFVDDADYNVAAAEAAGMPAFHFKGDVSELRLLNSATPPPMISGIRCRPAYPSPDCLTPSVRRPIRSWLSTRWVRGQRRWNEQ